MSDNQYIKKKLDYFINKENLMKINKKINLNFDFFMSLIIYSIIISIPTIIFYNFIDSISLNIFGIEALSDKPINPNSLNSFLAPLHNVMNLMIKVILILSIIYITFQIAQFIVQEIFIVRFSEKFYYMAGIYHFFNFNNKIHINEHYSFQLFDFLTYSTLYPNSPFNKYLYKTLDSINEKPKDANRLIIDNRDFNYALKINDFIYKDKGTIDTVLYSYFIRQDLLISSLKFVDTHYKSELHIEYANEYINLEKSLNYIVSNNIKDEKQIYEQLSNTVSFVKKIYNVGKLTT